jgi:hypothetical protein
MQPGAAGAYAAHACRHAMKCRRPCSAISKPDRGAQTHEVIWPERERQDRNAHGLQLTPMSSATLRTGYDWIAAFSTDMHRRHGTNCPLQWLA